MHQLPEQETEGERDLSLSSHSLHTLLCLLRTTFPAACIFHRAQGHPLNISKVSLICQNDMLEYVRGKWEVREKLQRSFIGGIHDLKHLELFKGPSILNNQSGFLRVYGMPDERSRCVLTVVKRLPGHTDHTGNLWFSYSIIIEQKNTAGKVAVTTSKNHTSGSLVF